MTPMQARKESRRWRPVLRMIDEIKRDEAVEKHGARACQISRQLASIRAFVRHPSPHDELKDGNSTCVQEPPAGLLVSPDRDAKSVRLAPGCRPPHSPGDQPNPPPGDQRPVYSPRAGLWNLKGDE